MKRLLVVCVVAALLGIGIADAAPINAVQVQDAISSRRGNSYFGTGYSAAGEVEVASQRSANGTADPQNNRASRTFVEFQLTQGLIDDAAAAAGTGARAELGFALEQVVNGPGKLEGLDIRYFGITPSDRTAPTLWNTPTQETAQNVIYATTAPGAHTGTFSNAKVVADIAAASAGSYVAFGVTCDLGVDNSVVVGGPADRQTYLLDDAAASFALGIGGPNVLVNPVTIRQTQGSAPSPAANLINNSGLSGTPDASNYTELAHSGGVWYTNAAFPNYFDAGAIPPQFILPFGRPYDVTDLVVWGYGGNANEASDFTVEFSTDGGLTFGGAVQVQTSFLLGTGEATLPLGGASTANAVRVTMTDNAGGRGLGGAGSGDRAGLGEIKFLAPPPDDAKFLVTPVGIQQTAGNTLGGYPLIALIDDSGFGGATPDASNYHTFSHAGGPGNTWVTATGVYPNNYFGTGQVDPQFILSLAEPTPLTDLVLWGYGGNANEASRFTVEFSDDGGASYYASLDVGVGYLMGAAMATLSFDGAYLADAVRLTMTDNAGHLGYGGAGPGDRVGLGEIKFLAVPEPTTLALTALGLIALIRRRRR